MDKKRPTSVSIHSEGGVVLHSGGGYISKSLVPECLGGSLAIISAPFNRLSDSVGGLPLFLNTKKAKAKMSVQNIYLRRSILTTCNFARIVLVPCYCPGEWCINDTGFIIQNYRCFCPRANVDDSNFNQDYRYLCTVRGKM